MKRTATFVAAILVALIFSPIAQAEGETYQLKYIFQKGDILRWEVQHRTRVKTSVTDTTKTAETTSISTKRWEVIEVDEKSGEITFVHSVDDVNMRQRMYGWQGKERIGTQEARYDSKKDKAAPPGFKDVERSVGTPLSTVSMTPLGKVTGRKRHQQKANDENEGGYMTIPLPEEAIAIGYTWTFPFEVIVPTANGSIRKIKTLQKFTLDGVKTGVAAIRVRTVIITPIDDPSLMTQLIQRLSSGTVKFDIDAGRIISQDMELDEEVVGFRGRASSLHYATEFTEHRVTTPAIAADPGKSSTR